MSKKQKTTYRDVPLNDDLFELLEMQAEAVSEEMLGRFINEVHAEGCRMQFGVYKERPQVTIFADGVGNEGEPVGVSGIGNTMVEAFLAAYGKVHSILDWQFVEPIGEEQKPPPRWG